MYCKRLKWRDEHGDSVVLLGIISNDDEHFVYFKTAKKSYTINKSVILSINDTNTIFVGGSQC